MIHSSSATLPPLCEQLEQVVELDDGLPRLAGAAEHDDGCAVWAGGVGGCAGPLRDLQGLAALDFEVDAGDVVCQVVVEASVAASVEPERAQPRGGSPAAELQPDQFSALDLDGVSEHP